MSSGVTAHRYPRSSARSAYVRVAAGAGLCLFVLAVSGPTVISALVVGPPLVLFIYYGWRVFVRMSGTLYCDQSGLRWQGLRTVTLRWIALTDLKLAYYTTRRDGEDGWMELTVVGEGARIVVESELSGFEQVVARSFAAARENNVPISAVSQRNLSVVLGESDTRFPFERLTRRRRIGLAA